MVLSPRNGHHRIAPKLISGSGSWIGSICRTSSTVSALTGKRTRNALQKRVEYRPPSHAYALLLLGRCNDLAIGWISNDRRAVRARAMGCEKPRQDIERNTSPHAADEVAVVKDRESHVNNWVAGIRVDFGVCHGQNPRCLCGRIARDSAIIDRGRNRIFADDMAPRVEERSMTAAIRSRPVVVDEVHMPIGIQRNIRIGASAIVVDPRDRPMIPVFEANEGSVDLLGRRQYSEKNLATSIGPEEIRVGRNHLGEQTERARHALDHVFHVFDASLSRFVNVIFERCHHHLRLPIVVVGKYENENWKTETDEKGGHDDAELGLFLRKAQATTNPTVQQPNQNWPDYQQYRHDDRGLWP